MATGNAITLLKFQNLPVFRKRGKLFIRNALHGHLVFDGKHCGSGSRLPEIINTGSILIDPKAMWEGDANGNQKVLAFIRLGNDGTI